MHLIEVFCSIQGEGPAMGRPATFVRLAGCNLRCMGCDTDLRQGHDLSAGDVANMVRGARAVITGGEPTLQMDELTALISLLHSQGKEVDIETNGTNPIAEETLANVHYAVVSPKRGSNCNLDYWALKENVHLKFVLGKEPWCWTAQLLEEIIGGYRLAKERVWIMAYGAEEGMQGAKEAWDLALRLGVNYSDRLHIRLMRR